jgi:hypothetical protein
LTAPPRSGMPLAAENRANTCLVVDSNIDARQGSQQPLPPMGVALLRRLPQATRLGVLYDVEVLVKGFLDCTPLGAGERHRDSIVVVHTPRLCAVLRCDPALPSRGGNWFAAELLRRLRAPGRRPPEGWAVHAPLPLAATMPLRYVGRWCTTCRPAASIRGNPHRTRHEPKQGRGPLSLMEATCRSPRCVEPARNRLDGRSVGVCEPRRAPCVVLSPSCWGG